MLENRDFRRFELHFTLGNILEINVKYLSEKGSDLYWTFFK